MFREECRDRNKRIIELNRQGVVVAAIASRLRCSTKVIYNLLAANDLRPNKLKGKVILESPYLHYEHKRARASLDSLEGDGGKF